MRDAALALLDAELATTEDAGLVDDLRARLNARYDSYVAAYGPVNRHTRQVRLRSTAEGQALRDQLLAEGEPGVPAARWRSATRRSGTSWSRPGTPPSPGPGNCGSGGPARPAPSGSG